MYWIAIAAATILVLIVAALAIPVDVDLTLEYAERLRGTARLRWLFGLVDVALGAEGAIAAPPDRRRDGTSITERRARSTSPPRRNVMPILRSTGLLRRLIRLARDLIRSVRVSRVVACARFGCEDPADTGQVCGGVLPLVGMASSKGVDVRCTPDFSKAVLMGSCAGTLSVTPLRLLVLVLLFAGSPPVWRAIRVWRALS
jgi:hypothetical protein